MNDVIIYTSQACPYCIRAEQLLNNKGITFKAINVQGNPAARQEAMTRSGQRTVPQIWIGETHVGGCDELYALERTGGLDALLESENIK